MNRCPRCGSEMGKDFDRFICMGCGQDPSNCDCPPVDL